MRYLAIAVLACAFAAIPAWAANTGVDDDATAVWNVPPEEGSVWTEPLDSVTLYDNGPFRTGPCGANFESQLQDASLGMTVFGFGHQQSANNRVADDFTVPAGACWQIDAITFFAYQTGAGTGASTMTAVNYQIWSGRPGDGGSVVIFGDTSTNRLGSSTWSQTYRTLQSAPCGATNRPIFANVCAAGVQLNGGTYWIDWQTAGSASFSGPWANPLVILGQCVTGNGRQSIAGVWGPLNDGGPQACSQGLPFIIEGRECATAVEASTWGAIKSIYQ